MNYIYDITLNLNKNKFYNFYEWEEYDPIEFILKIPIYKVDDETIFDLKNNHIVINQNILNLIKNKTEVYNKSEVNIIRYASLFSNGEIVIGVEFDSDGNNYMLSDLSIDDSEDILEEIFDIKYSLIDYKVTSKSVIKSSFKTRKEKEQEKYLISSLNKMYKYEEYEKIKYIYYEVYGEKNNDVEIALNKLNNIIKNNSDKYNKIVNLIKLFENTKIMTNNS